MTTGVTDTYHANPALLYGGLANEVTRLPTDMFSDTINIVNFNAKRDGVRLRGAGACTAGSNVITLTTAPPASGVNFQGWVGKLVAIRSGGESQDGLAITRFYSGKISAITTNGLSITVATNDTDGGLNISSGTGAILTAAAQDVFLGSNETTAFRNALAYLRGLGRGSLYIPHGVYLVTAPAQVFSFIEIYGDGDASFIQNARNSTPVTDNNDLQIFYFGSFGPITFGDINISAGTESTTVPKWNTRCAVGQSTAAVTANTVSITLAAQVNKSITAYASGAIRTGALHYVNLTATAHGYSENEHVLIAGMGAPYDGWWRILNVTTNAFDLRYTADANGDQVAVDFNAGYSLPGGATVSNRVSAAQFAPNDMVLVQSLDYTNQQRSATEYVKIPNWATFVKITNIVGQVITFDQNIGWSSGANTVFMMKPLTFKDTTNPYLLQNIATNNYIHHLRMGCLQAFGAGGFVRSTAHDLTLDQCDAFMSVNANCNSNIYNVRGTITRFAVEVKYVSHDCIVANFNLTFANATFGDGRGMFDLGEAARNIVFDTFSIHCPDMFKATGPAQGWTPVAGQLFQIQRGQDCAIRNGKVHAQNTTCTNVAIYRSVVTASLKFVSDPLFVAIAPTDVTFENVTTYQGATQTMISNGNAGSAADPGPNRIIFRNNNFNSTYASTGAFAVNATGNTGCVYVGNTFGYVSSATTPVGDLVLTATCVGTEFRGNRLAGFCNNATADALITGNVNLLSTGSATTWPGLPAERIRNSTRGPNTVAANKLGLMAPGVYHQLAKKVVYPAGNGVFDHWTDAQGKIAVVTGKDIRNQTWVLVGAESRNDTEVPGAKPIAVVRDDNTMMAEGTVTTLLPGQWGWDGTKIFIRFRENIAPSAITAFPATGDNSAGIRYIPAATLFLPAALPAPTVFPSSATLMNPGETLSYDGTTLPAGLTLEKGVLVMSTADGSQKRVTTAGTSGTAPLGAPTATTTNASKTVVVSSSVYLSMGQFISVAGALTAARITSITDATHVIVDTSASAAVTTIAITFPAPTLT